MKSSRPVAAVLRDTLGGSLPSVRSYPRGALSSALPAPAPVPPLAARPLPPDPAPTPAPHRPSRPRPPPYLPRQRLPAAPCVTCRDPSAPRARRVAVRHGRCRGEDLAGDV